MHGEVAFRQMQDGRGWEGGLMSWTARRRRNLSWFVGVAAAAAVVTALPGCRGCRRDPLVDRQKALKEQTKKKEKEKPKEDFEIAAVKTVPHDPDFAFPVAKPGHWVTAKHEVTANNFDFQGELRTAATNNLGEPYDVENTRFQLWSLRPAPLPKGQPRLLETTYFIPRAAAEANTGVWLNRELRAARGGRVVSQDPFKMASMPGYQYFFVVLSRDPDRYRYLKGMYSVAMPSTQYVDTDKILHYRVVLPVLGTLAPLPSQSLAWTSIAYVLWDDVDPSVLTPAQQQALLDWLHWGGQLIISGPGSLDQLRGGFLDLYLPAQGGRTVEIASSAVAEINSHWSLVDARTRRPLNLEPLPGRPLVGIELRNRAGGQFLPGCGGLVAERRVGRGRIAVTSFSLTDGLFLRWASYDSFFNACLLRRPPRHFEMRSQLLHTRWADYHPALLADARLVTTLRYFSRDIGHLASGTRPPAYEPDEELVGLLPDDPSTAESAARVELPREAHHPIGDAWHFNGYPARWRYGMAAWNDRSGASDAARESLKDAAGISIPRAGFVLRVLAVYLLILVPLNWAVFRLLGRVEGAWVAAPVIAVAAAVAVVRLAQLNIGFARSVTELAIVEAHAGYPRAHLTRYVALYTSLSTSYELVFQEQDALALPLGSAARYVRGPHDAAYPLLLRYGRQLRLQGFVVSSNFTDIIHCEQMCDLGGAIGLLGNASDGFLVQNGTSCPLAGVGILRRTSEGTLETAWVGELGAGRSARLAFRRPADGKPRLAPWDASFAARSYEAQAREILARLDRDLDGTLDRNEAAGQADLAAAFDRLDEKRDGRWDQEELLAWCRRTRAGEVSLGQLIELASEQLQLGPGEMRLLGWTTAEIPGVAVRPAAAQAVRRTLFLVHLRQGDAPAPRPDLNRPADVAPPGTFQPADEAEATSDSV